MYTQAAEHMLRSTMREMPSQQYALETVVFRWRDDTARVAQSFRSIWYSTATATMKFEGELSTKVDGETTNGERLTSGAPAINENIQQ